MLSLAVWLRLSDIDCIVCCCIVFYEQINDDDDDENCSTAFRKILALGACLNLQINKCTRLKGIFVDIL